MTETTCTTCVQGIIRSTGAICNVCAGTGTVIVGAPVEPLFPEVVKTPVKTKKPVKKVAIKKPAKKKRK